MTDDNKEGAGTLPASTGDNELDQFLSSGAEGGLNNAEGKTKSADELAVERDNYKRAFLREKEERLKAVEKLRAQELSPTPAPAYQPVQDPSIDYEEEKITQVFQKQQALQQAEQRKLNIGKAAKQFFKLHPEYAPENDLDGSRYAKLKIATDRMNLGNDVDEIIESLNFAHNGLNPNQPHTPEPAYVEDSGIGATTTIPRGATDKTQPSALTRPLNKNEQIAAKLYSGGEKAYREAMAEREAGRA